MSEKISRKELLDLLNTTSGNLQSKGDTIDDLDKKALSGYQYLEHGTAAEAIEDLEKRFNNWLPDQEVSRSASTIRMGRAQLFRRVAAIALLIIIPAFLLIRPNSTTRLADKYLKAPRSTYLNMTRGENVPEEKDIANAFMLYEREKFAEAASAIGELVSQYPEKPDLQFYQAISLLASNQIDQAIPLFEQLSTQTYQDVNKKSPWYLGLAYLKRGDRVQAAKWFKEAVALDDLHARDAERILARIE